MFIGDVLKVIFLFSNPYNLTISGIFSNYQRIVLPTGKRTYDLDNHLKSLKTIV